MSPLLILGHPKYHSKAVVPKLGSHLGNSLKRMILRLNSRLSSPVMSPRNVGLTHTPVVCLQKLHKAFTKASQSPISLVPLLWPQQNSHGVKKSLKALAVGIN